MVKVSIKDDDAVVKGDKVIITYDELEANIFIRKRDSWEDRVIRDFEFEVEVSDVMDYFLDNMDQFPELKEIKDSYDDENEAYDAVVTWLENDDYDRFEWMVQNYSENVAAYFYDDAAEEASEQSWRNRGSVI